MDSDARDPVSGDTPMPRDPLSIRIDAMLHPNDVSQFITRRVPDELRSKNEAAYEPQVLSIGPYHHGKQQLEKMQDCKKLCLERILKRHKQNVDVYVKALRGLEEEARGSYEEPVTMDSNDFVEMLLLDGCFILERILQRTDYDYELLSRLRLNQSGIVRDMLLLENQLPFTVVKKLFSLSKHEKEKQIEPHFLKFLDDSLKKMNIRIMDRGWQQNRDVPWTHLLGIVQLHWNLLPSDWRDCQERTTKAGQIIPPQSGQTEEQQMCSAIKLKEAGIQFSEGTFLLKFKDGILEIPRLPICKEYESLLQNLIAYEHLLLEGISNKVINFAMVMKFLIADPGDVELLRRHKIIVPTEAGMRDYNGEQIRQLFRALLQGIDLRSDNFIHLDILTDAEQYGSRRWMAKCNWCL